MKKSMPKIRLEARVLDTEHTAHALLIPIYEKANELGLFERLGAGLKIAMRTNDYTWLDKLKTLWASIVLGCSHTVEINTVLGAQESALASVFGLERFPDQSGINRLLHRVTPDSVTQVRQVAFELLVRHSRARDRWRWLRLPGGRRLLVVDIDQRGLVVSSRRYELAEAAFFGTKRRRRGYRLTLAYLGGDVGEVLDEHFDAVEARFASRTPAEAETELARLAKAGLRVVLAFARRGDMARAITRMERVRPRVAAGDGLLGRKHDLQHAGPRVREARRTAAVRHQRTRALPLLVRSVLPIRCRSP